MREYELTKEAATLLLALYKSYKQERGKGVSRNEAALLGGSEHIQKTILPDWSVVDVDDALCELVGSGLVNCLQSGDNLIQAAELTPAAIAFMQSRVKRAAGKAASAVKGLLDMIP